MVQVGALAGVTVLFFLTEQETAEVASNGLACHLQEITISLSEAGIALMVYA